MNDRRHHTIDRRGSGRGRSDGRSSEIIGQIQAKAELSAGIDEGANHAERDACVWQHFPIEPAAPLVFRPTPHALIGNQPIGVGVGRGVDVLTEGEDEVLLIVFLIDLRKHVEQRQQRTGVTRVAVLRQIPRTPAQLEAAGVMFVRADKHVIFQIKTEGAAGIVLARSECGGWNKQGGE